MRLQEAEEAKRLLMDLLRIPSVNARDDERKIADFVAKYFRGHGISSKLQNIDDRHANVLAWIPGQDEDRTMIWNGHLDTVPYGSLEEWNTDPSQPVEQDGKIYARGASDMKSGLAAMIYVLTHMQKKPCCNIQFIGTCDEEKSGIGAEAVVSAGSMKPADWLLIGEPTGMALGIAQKGCLWLELKVKGRTSHGAYPQEGANAIEYGMTVAWEIKSYVEQFAHPLLGSATAQINQIEGGMVPNMTADTCNLVMDIRMVPGLNCEMVITQGRQVLARMQKINPAISVEFCVLNDRRAIEIHPQDRLVADLRGILMQMNYKGDDTGINFFTDASILDREGQKSVLLFGPGDAALAHQPNEYVKTDNYLDAIEVLRRLLELQV